MGFTLLIVEDSAPMREALATALEALPEAHVVGAASGYEGLRLLPRHRFDLIITDLHMADINGFELVRFIRASPLYRETPLFVLTSDASERVRQQGLALGATEYLVKPFDPARLVELARRYLERGNRLTPDP